MERRDSGKPRGAVVSRSGRGGQGGRRQRTQGALESSVRRFLANSTGPICSFIAGPVLARALGVEGRGLLSAISAPITLLMSILHLAGGEVLAAELASRRAKPGDLFWPSAVLFVVAGALLGGGLHLLAPVLLGGHPTATSLLQVLGWSLIPTGVQVSLRALRLAERRYSLINKEPVVGSVGRLLVLLLLWALGALTLTTAAVATVLSMLVSLVFLGLPTPLRTRHSPREWLAVMRAQAWRSARVLMGNLAGLLNARLDQMLMIPLAGAQQLGLYAVAVAIAELPVVGTDAVRQILLTETASRTDPALVARACRLLITLLLLPVLIGAALAGPLLAILFGEAFREAAAATAVLLFGTVLVVPSNLLSTGLVALGRQSLSGVPAIVGLVVTVVGAPVTLPHLGALGAALVSAASYSSSSVVAVGLYGRVTGVKAVECMFIRRTDLALLRELFTQRRNLATCPDDRVGEA